ncbi:hypothetical protein [Halostagnicola kamekurae]|uniref:Uncharacterized protein n=1 Tax=Halostagnicola kamekurae TaxID=619731 RepID=A0A1I6RF14_9EURY|nr:hypothetical protein [Halostagnicola kamekurae]SFS63341.1 hypothetical protein SAMN04488556_1751 [Halostagnicola kamekurae]
MRAHERGRLVLKHELSKYYLRVRDHDISSIVRRLQKGFVDGEFLGLRNRGFEAIVFQRSYHGFGKIISYQVLDSGHTTWDEVLCKTNDPTEWLENHRDDLEWVHYEWR